MPAELGPGTGSAPRRARYLIPEQLPRRGEIVAALVTALLLAHLVFAQLTFVLAVVFAGISKTSRWRLSWLAAPAAAGVLWTFAIGTAAAAAGFSAGPRRILGYLGTHGLLHVHGAFADAGSWLPRQFPLALIAAAAEAAVVGWLNWLHTDEWAVPPARPGLLAAARRALTTRAIRGGAVVTRDGATLGVVPATGARATLGWAEVAGGVLFTGAAGRDISATGFQLVHAALRLRKPVIALDLTGDPAMGSALAAACSAAGTPLRTFGTGDGSYEPFRDADPERRTELTLAMLGAAATDARAAAGSGAPGAPLAANSRGAELCLRTAFELMSAVPADAQTPVLDDVLHLLNPLAARARLRLVPADGPLAAQLADRVQAMARLAEGEPETLTAVARGLAEVRACPDGGWLRPGGAGPPDIDLARVIRERAAALFRPHSPQMARLVCADLLALGDDLRRIEADGDAVVVLCGCEKLPAGTVARLVDSGATAGLPVLAATTSAAAAAGLAEVFGALVIHRLAAADARVGATAAPEGCEGASGSAVASLAARTGIRLVPAAVAAAQSGLPEAVPPPGAAPHVPPPGAVPHDPPPGAAAHVPPVPAPRIPRVPSAGALGLVPQPTVPVRTLLSLRTGQFTVVVQAPRPRTVALGQTVPARLPRQLAPGRRAPAGLPAHAAGEGAL